MEQGRIGKIGNESGIGSNIFFFSKHAMLVLRVYLGNIIYYQRKFLEMSLYNGNLLTCGLGQVLNRPEPQFFHLQNRDGNTYITELFGWGTIK